MLHDLSGQLQQCRSQDQSTFTVKYFQKLALTLWTPLLTSCYAYDCTPKRSFSQEQCGALENKIRMPDQVNNCPLLRADLFPPFMPPSDVATTLPIFLVAYMLSELLRAVYTTRLWRQVLDREVHSHLKHSAQARWHRLTICGGMTLTATVRGVLRFAYSYAIEVFREHTR